MILNCIHCFLCSHFTYSLNYLPFSRFCFFLSSLYYTVFMMLFSPQKSCLLSFQPLGLWTQNLIKQIKSIDLPSLPILQLSNSNHSYVNPTGFYGVVGKCLLDRLRLSLKKNGRLTELQLKTLLWFLFNIGFTLCLFISRLRELKRICNLFWCQGFGTPNSLPYLFLNVGSHKKKKKKGKNP